FFLNDNTGFTVGDSGTILKTTNGGVTGLEPFGNEIPKDYNLYQNYPNPFNPVTKIKFDIPPLNLPLTGGDREGGVMKVYDILGREVAALVNENLKPGTYEVEWDSSDYPSGIYYYKLISGNYTNT